MTRIKRAYILELKVSEFSELRDGVMSNFRRDIQLDEGHLLRACASSAMAFLIDRLVRTEEGWVGCSHVDPFADLILLIRQRV